jgi:hypothetical protein
VFYLFLIVLLICPVKCMSSYMSCTLTLYRKLETNFPRNETAQPKSINRIFCSAHTNRSYQTGFGSDLVFPLSNKFSLYKKHDLTQLSGEKVIFQHIFSPTRRGIGSNPDLGLEKSGPGSATQSQKVAFYKNSLHCDKNSKSTAQYW